MSLQYYNIFKSDSMNILIIHSGLLLKERILDLIGHHLWGGGYNVTCLLWMIRYISLFTNAFTQWIHIGAYCFFYFSPPSQWCGYKHDLRCSQVERRWWRTLIMCYKQYSMGSCIMIFGTLLEQIYQLTFYPFLFYVRIYIQFMFLMYCDLHA